MNGFKKLTEVFSPILEFKEKKRTFAKIMRGNVDFFVSLFVLNCDYMFCLFSING